MRILHLIPTLGAGGAERQLAYLARALAGRGHEMHVGLLRGGANAGRLTGSPVQVHQLGVRGHHDPRLGLEVWRLVRQVRPDAVQSWLTLMDVLGGGAAIAQRTPWVLSERASPAAYPPSAKNALRRRMGRHADAIVANSMGGLEYWEGQPPRVRRAVVLNGLPLDEIDACPPVPRHDVPGPDLPIVLHVGRLAPEKNVESVIKGFARCRTAMKLVLVGDGPEKDRLHRLVAELGLARQVVAISHSDQVWSLMKGAAAVVSASHQEGQPNVLLEAMACRCPIVASRIPPHLEILDAESALMVDRESPEAIGNAIDAIMSDPMAAARRADVARVRVADRTFDRCAEQYEALYERVIRDSAHRRSTADTLRVAGRTSPLGTRN